MKVVCGSSNLEAIRSRDEIGGLDDEQIDIDGRRDFI
jgi:hypothetical protein